MLNKYAFKFGFQECKDDECGICIEFEKEFEDDIAAISYACNFIQNSSDYKCIDYFKIWELDVYGVRISSVVNYYT